MLTKIRRYFTIAQRRDDPDNHHLICEMPVGAEDVELMFIGPDPYIVATSAPNAPRALHDLYVIAANEPFSIPAGRTTQLLRTVPMPADQGGVAVLSFYKLLPWPELVARP